MLPGRIGAARAAVAMRAGMPSSVAMLAALRPWPARSRAIANHCSQCRASW
ncbi:MAG: class I SAM-dependent methyltransferase [Chloroflexi bacterium]|nr:MAG: class I SAM-dependent methyltransferase [Chloroflexota bacterium]